MEKRDLERIYIRQYLPEHKKPEIVKAFFGKAEHMLDEVVGSKTVLVNGKVRSAAQELLWLMVQACTETERDAFVTGFEMGYKAADDMRIERNGETDNGETDNGETDNGETDNGETDNGETDNGETGNGETGNGETGNGETGNRETDIKG